MTPVGFFGLGIMELIILAVLGAGLFVGAVLVVFLIVVLNKPKGPTND